MNSSQTGSYHDKVNTQEYLKLMLQNVLFFGTACSVDASSNLQSHKYKLSEKIQNIEFSILNPRLLGVNVFKMYYCLFF